MSGLIGALGIWCVGQAAAVPPNQVDGGIKGQLNVQRSRRQRAADPNLGGGFQSLQVVPDNRSSSPDFGWNLSLSPQNRYN